MGILIMGNENYLSIIRKSDFVDLFKYGWLNIGWAVPFDGNMDNHQDDDLFASLTNRINLFEYSFEYLIIHFFGESSNTINITDVRGIYTFDAEAKREMENSFDSRIQICVSPWVEKMQELRKKLFIKQSLKGVDNLWTIFGLADDDKAKCEAIITSEIINETFHELFKNERPKGALSLWVYLLRYERHSFYPRDMRGFFCDCIHTVCNWKKKEENMEDVAENTGLYKQLMSCKKEFAPLSEIMAASPLASMTEQSANCRYVVAAPLFLFLKDKFNVGIDGKVEERFITYAKEIGGFECSLAVYLLGLTLGHDKTYDAYYDAVKLPIFKQKVETVDTQNVSPNMEETIVVDSGNKEVTSHDGSLWPEFQKNTPLAKLHKGGGKNFKVCNAYTQEELENLISQGWKKYKSNKKKK